MDIATVMGIIVFMGLAVTAIFIQEGLGGFKPFLNLEALLLIAGGTFCSTLVKYPLKDIVGLGKILRKVLLSSGEDTSKIVEIFVAL